MRLMSARALAAAIRDGETTSTVVVRAHVERLCHAAGLNALVAERFEAALADAEADDRRVAGTPPEERSSLPPLLGVPCTIKESIAYAGMPNCAGVVHRRGVLAERSAPVVERLLGAGAIPLGVTNTSELTMWIESENRVYGRTRNAYDPRRTAGGSSGGEGAAVGSGGSPFGIGSDMGGSIRLPAYFNGVFGHKPTPGIVPNSGQWPFDEGESARMVGIGPLARRAEDLIEVLRIIAGPDGEDRRAREVAIGDPASIEIAGLDVLVATRTSLTPVRRSALQARERAVRALAAAGARVRVEPMPALRRAMELYLAALDEWSEGTAADLLTAEGNPALRLRDLWPRRADHTAATALLIAGEQVGRLLPWRRGRRLVAAVESLRAEVLGVLGEGVLLHPPYPGPVPRHRRTLGRPWVLGPTAAFNLIGLPATEIPLGLGRDGLPTGVQAIAAPDRDHATIAVARELERAFGGWVEPRRWAPASAAV
jgi:fatty acid amide hydrolase 2